MRGWESGIGVDGNLGLGWMGIWDDEMGILDDEMGIWDGGWESGIEMDGNLGLGIWDWDGWEPWIGGVWESGMGIHEF